MDERRDPTVERVRAAHVHGYLMWRRTRRGDGGRGNVSNRTMAKDRAVLHRIFALAKKVEYHDGNPVADVDAPKSDGRTPLILSRDEYEKLVTAREGRPILACYVVTLAETGVRSKSESLWLSWEDVHMEDGFLWIDSGRNAHRTKSGKGRWVPMTPRLRQTMREHFARYRFATYNGKPTPWVFHHERTGRRHKAGERVQSLYAAFKSAARRAKLPPDFNQHDLRHRRVTTWLAEGKNPVHVKEAMGHADLATTMGYTHLVGEHLKALVQGPNVPGTQADASRAS